jgi:FkbM family methyltransferase
MTTLVNAGIEVKKTVRKILRATGWDIIRYNNQNSASMALVQQLRLHRVDTLLDVGANAGQYTASLRESGYGGRVFSFEPLESAHARLLQAASKDLDWKVAPRMALGNEDGTLAIHVAANSWSSSALKMLDAHVRADPGSRYVAEERVRVARLDTVALELGIPGENLFLKIDVQGFERQVLDGAAGLGPRIKGVQLELSLVPLYEGQELFLPLIDALTRDGFEVCGFLPGWVEPATGRTLQVDAIFFRP